MRSRPTSNRWPPDGAIRCYETTMKEIAAYFFASAAFLVTAPRMTVTMGDMGTECQRGMRKKAVSYIIRHIEKR